MRLSPADKAMLITFTGASLLVLVFFFLGVKPYQNPNPEEEFIEIPVVQELEEEQPEQKRVVRSKAQSHRAYNARQLQQESQELFEQEDAVRKAIEEQRASVQELNSTTENALSESKKKRQEAIAQHTKEVRKQIEAREQEREAKYAAGKRESTVSYNLLDRQAIYIPNPVYTCDAQGKIVLNITVNGKGAVTQMTYNSSASSSSNGCLIDQARAYAKDAIFNKALKASQLGSITFNFQG